MGDTQSKPAEANGATKDQVKILAQASTLARQLNLYETESELADQRHLFARVLLYGHMHLITHLKTFEKEKQIAGVRYLRTIDFETLDLLYQNLVLRNIRGERAKASYKKVQLKDKKQEMGALGEDYERVVQIGKMLLAQKKVGILVFAGGCSSRFRDKDGHVMSKELYCDSEHQKCMLELLFDKIQSVCSEYGKLIVYLVHSENNHLRVNDIIKDYAHSFRVKKMLQDEMPAVNLSGKLCIKSEKAFDVLLSPNGCGNIVNCTVRSKKFLEDATYESLDYIYAVGVENLAEQVCDPYMIGLLGEDQSIGVTYKCTHPENEGENLPRVVVNKDKKCPEVNQLEELLSRADKDSWSDIRRSPVFTNSIYFRTAFLEESMAKLQEKLGKESILFTPKKSKCSIWNPINKVQLDNQHCYIFEKELSDLLVSGNPHSMGVLVAREEEYIPVFSLLGDKKWADGMEQYSYLAKKTVRETAYFSLSSNLASDQEM